MVVEIEQELINIFKEDKDITNIHCVEVSKDYIEHNLFKNTINFNNARYLYTWNYNKGTAIVEWCRE